MTQAKTNKTGAQPGGKALEGTVPVGALSIPTLATGLDFGDAAPRFSAPALNGNQNYVFDSAAGRPILLLLLGSGSWGPTAEALAVLKRHAAMFDDDNARFFGVSVDPTDVAQCRIAQRIPGIRWFLDYDMKVSRLYGALGGGGERSDYRPYWLLLDSTMRVVTRAPIDQGERVIAALKALMAAGEELPVAPVLTVPRVFEPELCRELIRIYETQGGSDSGFMRSENGKTVPILDHAFKRRSDSDIRDPHMRAALLDRLRRRLVPQIERAFHYRPTRIERWMVGCYDADTGGFFRPHRDNTTAGTAHRVFACTINLNAEEFEGGELRFPEYGTRSYRAPTGGAVVFSCSLLHEAMPVTRGRRYAFLPFFYDEEKAELRERNQVHLANSDGKYRAGTMPEPSPSAPPAA